MNSTHKVEVFRVDRLEKHPNADTLDVMRIFDNYQCLVRTGDFKIGDLACYVPPDSIMPDKPEYAFLGSSKRIKAKKLRGVVSMGLVLQAPIGLKEGDDAAEKLGVTHYVPKVNSGRYGTGMNSKKFLKYSDFIKGPLIEGPYYDIDSWFRYGSALEPGEQVEITEKIHGTNARFTWQKGKLWVASRSGYRRPDKSQGNWLQRWIERLLDVKYPKSIYWEAVRQNPWIESLCKQYPNQVFYGEIYGDVQDLKYGAEAGQLKIGLFDVYDGKQFVDHYERREMIAGWDQVPILYIGSYSVEVLDKYLSGSSTITKDHVREGIVIKPLKERCSPKIGRVILKAVSPQYLERAA